MLFLVVSTVLPLMADKADSNITLVQSESLIPNVPELSITYLGEALTCSPTGLIKQKSHKDLVTYRCQGEYSDYVSKKKREEQRGNDETRRLADQIKQKMDKGAVYSVQIPIDLAKRPARASLIAQRQLNDRPYGKYLRMLRPAKLYVSIRPQLANSGDDGKIELRNGGSRGGFFYYHQFKNDLELALHYEAKADFDSHTPFIDTADASDSHRRLSYFMLKSGSNSIVLGKYWSAYYDIASFTDRYMAYGAQASGAFNSGTDGGPSGTGRVDRMIQISSRKEAYDATLQFQFKHDALRDFNTDYHYTVAGSFIYKGWDKIRLGASLDYGKFDAITSQMKDFGIDGNDLSSIMGVTYKKDDYGINAVFSYTKNHMSDDQGTYFDAVGTEFYMHYDIEENYRIAAGGNWLIPRDDKYDGKYSIKNLLLSFQYTFGKKTFDDMIYMEVSLPNGKLANGKSRDVSVAIGLRYLLDN
jgi:hypothetical protein